MERNEDIWVVYFILLALCGYMLLTNGKEHNNFYEQYQDIKTRCDIAGERTDELWEEVFNQRKDKE